MTSPLFYVLLTILVLTGGCVSRAPTKCELDKRSGMYPSSFCDGDFNDEGAKQGSTPQAQTSITAARSSVDLPVREGPVVAKVWVSDQVLDGGHWLQGSWLLVEVDSAKWSGEVRRVKATSARLGEAKSKATGPSFNPVADPVTPSESPKSTRAGRGGDK